MRLAERLFEIGLAHILAVIGLVVSLFVWRAGDLAITVSELRRTWSALRAGPVTLRANQRERALWMLVLRSGLWTVSLLGCLVITISMFRFLHMMATLYEVADRVDVTVVAVLGQRADVIRESIVVTGLVVSVLLSLEWIVGLAAETPAVREGSAPSEHLFVIPREWRDAPAEMWRQRVSEATERDVGDRWRYDWAAWIDMVGEVRDCRNPLGNDALK